jgi:integrase
MAVLVREKVKGSGEWWVFINHKGKRRSKKIGSKKAANKVKREVEERLGSGEFGLAGAPILRAYGEKHLKSNSRDWQDNTVDAYNGAWLNHIQKSNLAKLRLDEIKPKHIVAWIEELLNKGLSRNTIDVYKSCLYGVLDRAIVDEHITHNPCAKIMKYLGGDRAKRKEKKKAKALTAEKAQDAIDRAGALYGIMEKALWTLLFRSGMRPGEVSGLNWEDIDLEAGAVAVTKQYVMKQKKMGPVKTYEEREVFLTPATVQALQAWKRELGAKAQGDVPVFFTPDGNRLRHDYFTRHYRQIADEGTPYWTRHTYASLRLMKGHNILEVSNQLGHKDTTTTLKEYAHFMKLDRSQVDELDTLHLSAPHTHPGDEKAVELLKH